MIELNYEYSRIKLKDLKQYEKKINKIVNDFKKGDCLGKDFLGWYEYPNQINSDLIGKIKKDSRKIVLTSDVFVVCGIGGSYLGSRAVIEAIKGFRNTNIEIIYLGNTFDERYIKDVLKYLEKKDFCVNVISKSGSTLETAIAFRMLKQLLERKYGERSCDRIYVTTDEKKGLLRKIAEKHNYSIYDLPSDIGGRYSVFTPVGLLPLCVAGVDIDEFVDGARTAYCDFNKNCFEKNISCQYAAYRYKQYCDKNKIEIFVTYSLYLQMLQEWWKQLFGESEGKNELALFPASLTFSTDLHSMGQYVQDGSKIAFITQLIINDKGNLCIKEDNENEDNLNYLKDKTLSQINLIAQKGTNIAHYNTGKVDNFGVVIDEINEFNVGYLLYTFMLSCMISANLLEVNPFDQPGVEYYKSEMKNILKNN